MRLAAVCAIYGGYDLIPPVPEGVDDAVLITDVPVRSGWRNVVEPSHDRPRLASKRPKCRPDLYTDCDASLWMDGSLHVLDDRFVQLVRQKLEQHEIVLWDHPEDRDCFLQEAEHCHDWDKYRDGPLLEQAQSYLAQGMPEHFGLWAAGCIGRRHNDRMRELGDAWLDEMQRWTIKDQVSLPYLFWKEGIEPGTFGIDQLDNDLVALMAHAQELRDHRRIVLGLESELIAVRAEVDHFRVVFPRLEAEHGRLRRRKAVRLALWAASLAAGLVRTGRRTFRRERDI